MKSTKSNVTTFASWVEDHIGHTDAVGMFADWLFSKRVKNGSRSEDFIEKCLTFEDSRKWLVSKNAPKAIKYCFPTAWRLYQQWVGEMEVLGAQADGARGDREYPVVMTVERRLKDGVHDTVESDGQQLLIDIRRFVTAPAKINVRAGMTLGLPNFSSFRIDVGVEVPCYLEEVDSSYDTVKNWAKSRVEHEVVKFQKDLREMEETDIDDVELPPLDTLGVPVVEYITKEDDSDENLI